MLLVEKLMFFPCNFAHFVVISLLIRKTSYQLELSISVLYLECDIVIVQVLFSTEIDEHTLNNTSNLIGGSSTPYDLIAVYFSKSVSFNILKFSSIFAQNIWRKFANRFEL